MPKIGDVYSGGGTHIGEIWSGDDGSGCGVWIVIGIILFPIACVVLLIQGILWIWNRDAAIVIGTATLPIGVIFLLSGAYIIRLGKRGLITKRHALADFLTLVFLGIGISGTILSLYAMTRIFYLLPQMNDSDHATGTVLLLGLWVLFWLLSVISLMTTEIESPP